MTFHQHRSGNHHGEKAVRRRSATIFQKRSDRMEEKKTESLKSNDAKSDNWVRDLDSFMTLTIEYGWTAYNDDRWVKSGKRRDTWEEKAKKYTWDRENLVVVFPSCLDFVTSLVFEVHVRDNVCGHSQRLSPMSAVSSQFMCVFTCVAYVRVRA